MSGGRTSEFLGVLDRRGSILRALADGPLGKPELESALEVSRSTIDRGVRELEEHGLVRRCDDGFERTPCGRIALAEYDRFAERADGLSRASGLLADLDGDPDIDAALLADARVAEATRASPGRPIEALYEVVDRADEVRGFGPSIHPQQVDVYSRRILEEGMRADFVITEGALEQLVSRYGDSFEAGLATDRARFYTTDAEMPYSLTLADTPDGRFVGVLVYDHGSIQGCILNDAAAAVEWGERRYAAMRETATPVA